MPLGPDEENDLILLPLTLSLIFHFLFPFQFHLTFEIHSIFPDIQKLHKKSQRTEMQK